MNQDGGRPNRSLSWAATSAGACGRIIWPAPARVKTASFLSMRQAPVTRIEYPVTRPTDGSRARPSKWIAHPTQQAEPGPVSLSAGGGDSPVRLVFRPSPSPSSNLSVTDVHHCCVHAQSPVATMGTGQSRACLFHSSCAERHQQWAPTMGTNNGHQQWGDIYRPVVGPLFCSIVAHDPTANVLLSLFSPPRPFFPSSLFVSLCHRRPGSPSFRI